jgi:predicted secreted hydrolase
VERLPFRRAAALAVIALAAAGVATVQASPFSYPYTDGLLSFPEDEARHPLLRWPFTVMEWFAVYGHVTSDEGYKFSFFATLVGYDPLERIESIGSFFPHSIFVLTDETNQAHYSYASYAPLAAFDSTRPRIETEDGNLFEGKGWQAPFQYELQVEGQEGDIGYSLDLDLDMIKRPLIVNGTGYVRQPEGVSGYYAMTRLAVDGDLTLAGKSRHVQGVGWIDRQWLGASFALNNHYAYEWWCITLDNGEEAILYRIWDTDTDTVASRLFEINRAGDRGWRDAIDDYTFKNLDYWTSPRSPHYRYSHGWRLSSPTAGWDLTIEPWFDDQEASSPIHFWSGSCRVEGFAGAEAATGVAYAELLYSYNGMAEEGPRCRSLPLEVGELGGLLAP